jgi:hypothetical protein
MTEASGAKDAPHPFTDEARALGIDVDDPRALAWMREHLPEFRRQASGQRPLYWILGIGFVVGLAVHVGGYLLRSSATTEPLELVADLLYSLGFALWTGVVVALFVQIWPEANGASSSGGSMPTRQRGARRPEPEATRRRGTTERRRRGSAGLNGRRGRASPIARAGTVATKPGPRCPHPAVPPSCHSERDASGSLRSTVDTSGHLTCMPSNGGGRQHEW